MTYHAEMLGYHLLTVSRGWDSYSSEQVWWQRCDHPDCLACNSDDDEERAMDDDEPRWWALAIEAAERYVAEGNLATGAYPIVFKRTEDDWEILGTETGGSVNSIELYEAFTAGRNPDVEFDRWFHEWYELHESDEDQQRMAAAIRPNVPDGVDAVQFAKDLLPTFYAWLNETIDSLIVQKHRAEGRAAGDREDALASKQQLRLAERRVVELEMKLDQQVGVWQYQHMHANMAELKDAVDELARARGEDGWSARHVVPVRGRNDKERDRATTRETA